MNRELKRMQQRSAAKIAAAQNIVRENTQRTTVQIDQMIRNERQFRNFRKF